MKNIFVFLFLIFSLSNLFSQAYWDTVTVSPLEICLGDCVDPYSNGGNATILMNNNFNNGTIGTGWSSNSAQFDNPCTSTGDNWDGTTYLWVGPAASFPRDLTTVAFTVTDQCQICFDFKMATQGNSSPCEGPDEPDEGVSLQWNNNDGSGWHDITYFCPDGNEYSSNNGQGSSGGYSGPFLVWDNYCYNVPAAAAGNNTQFQWHQNLVTDNDYDHWGIDNVFINCPSPDVTITWEDSNNGVFSHDADPPQQCPTQNTTYTATIDDGIGSDVETFDVIVYQPPTLDIQGLAPAYCLTQSAVTMTGLPAGGTFSGPGVTGTQFDPASAGLGTHTITYDWDQVDSQGNVLCSFSTTTSVIVNNGPTADFTVVTPLCTGTNTTITYTGTGSSSASYTWNWGGLGVTPGTGQGPHTGTAAVGTYTVSLQVTENGCTGDLVSHDIVFNPYPTANAGTDDDQCGLTYTLGASPSIGTGTWTQTAGPGTSTFATASSANSDVTVSQYGTYTFQWEENSNTCIDNDEVQITFWEIPVPNAGPDDAICGLNYTLAAVPTVGTGTWTASPSTGVSFTNIHSATSSVSVATEGAYTFTWTEENGQCTASDDVNIEFIEIPIANAGATNIDVCGPDYTMTAIPSVGTGTWTASPTTASFTNVNNATSVVSVSAYGSYNFTWTEVNQTCTDDQTVTINFYEIPTPNAGIDDVVCGPDYTLNASSSVGTGIWSTTSGAANILSPNQVNSGTTVNVYGTYTYTYTEDNHGCIESDDVDITYYQIPTSDFTASIVNCFQDNSTVTYTGNASSSATYTWNWDTGSAIPGSGQGPNNVNWNTANTFTISLQVTENGCQSPITTHDVINPELLTSTATSTDILCFGDANGTLSATYTGGTFPYTTVWNSGDSTLNVSDLSGGNYQIVITDAMGCTSTSTTVINEPTKLELSPIENYFVCNGASINAQASVTGGTPNYIYYWDGVQSSNPNYSENPVVSNSSHCVIVVDQNNCKDTSCFNISVSEPVVLQLYANTDSVCPNDPVLVTASISGGIGPPYMVTDYYTGDVVSPPVVINPSENGDISMIVEDGCGSKDTSTVDLNLYPLPPNNFESDIQSGCQPLKVTFIENSTQNGQSYVWDFGDNSTDNLSLGKNPIHTYNVSGNFDVTLTVTSDKGCENIVTKPNYITVYPKPVAKFLFKPEVATIVKPTVTFTNLSTLISSALWDFNDGDSSSLINPTHKFPDLYPGDYNVKLITMTVYGCKDTATSIVPIKPVPTLYAPTAFSPDKDRVNDNFFITGTGIDPENFLLRVYDRWGEIIWETSTFNVENATSEMWNGTAKNHKLCQNGIYTWLATYIDTDGNKQEFSGIVSLIR